MICPGAQRGTYYLVEKIGMALGALRYLARGKVLDLGRKSWQHFLKRGIFSEILGQGGTMGRHFSILGPRPSSFMKRATLAAELDVSESTIDTYVQRGFLPKPVRVGGSVLWYWPHVEAALLGAGAAEQGDDPFMRGVDNV